MVGGGVYIGTCVHTHAASFYHYHIMFMQRSTQKSSSSADEATQKKAASQKKIIAQKASEAALRKWFAARRAPPKEVVTDEENAAEAAAIALRADQKEIEERQRADAAQREAVAKEAVEREVTAARLLQEADDERQRAEKADAANAMEAAVFNIRHDPTAITEQRNHLFRQIIALPHPASVGPVEWFRSVIHDATQELIATIRSPASFRRRYCTSNEATEEPMIVDVTPELYLIISKKAIAEML
jgi:hypothetical protein